jgi:hypothetical protein
LTSCCCSPARASTAYFRSRRATPSPYFAALGYACPDFTNPADFFLDITAVNSQSKELIAESKARIRGADRRARRGGAASRRDAAAAADAGATTRRQIEVTLAPEQRARSARSSGRADAPHCAQRLPRQGAHHRALHHGARSSARCSASFSSSAGYDARGHSESHRHSLSDLPPTRRLAASLPC